MSSVHTTAPGYSLQALLSRAPDAELRALAGHAVGVLELLEGGPLSRDRLLNLVLDIRDQVELLREPTTRQRLIAHLPFEKHAELVALLRDGTGPARLPFTDRLAAIKRNSPQEQALLRFFGVSEFAQGPRQGVHPDTAEVAPGYGLFPFQRTAVRSVVEHLESEPRRVVLHLPTGAGKTRSAMHVIAWHLREHGPTLVVWLAYSGELLDQAADEFEVAWQSLGDRPLPVVRYWGSSGANLLDHRDGLVVAGLSKLHSAARANFDTLLRLADRTSLTVMDEAHQAIAQTYRELLELLSTKRPRSALLGLTATPGRTWSDIEADQALADFFGRRKVMLQVDGYDNPVRYLIDAGYLARPAFSTLNGDAGLVLSKGDLAELARALDVPQGILNRLADDEQRNLRIVAKTEELLQHHRRILIFATTVQHAKTIAAILHARGREARCVTGDTPTADRQRAIDLFRSNNPRPMVLTNFGVLTTGFDAPSTSAALIARPTRSLVLYSQMVGRAARGPKAGGNVACEIVTVVDPQLPGFGDIADAFTNWEDVW